MELCVLLRHKHHRWDCRKKHNIRAYRPEHCSDVVRGCGVVQCSAVQCGVVWCGVPKALLPNGKRPGCLPKGKGKRAGLCVLCARCV